MVWTLHEPPRVCRRLIGSNQAAILDCSSVVQLRIAINGGIGRTHGYADGDGAANYLIYHTPVSLA
jgi:hypothetical protein